MPASKKTVEQLVEVLVDKLGGEKALDVITEIQARVEGTGSFKKTISDTKVKLLVRVAKKRAEAKF